MSTVPKEPPNPIALKMENKTSALHIHLLELEAVLALEDLVEEGEEIYCLL